MSKFCYRCFSEERFTGIKPKCNKTCKKKVVYFMRGVASCGKSYTAKLIAGKKGIVIETDSYFERPGRTFRFIQSKRKEAYAWVYDSLKHAIRNDIRTIVIDRGNSPSKFSRKLMKYAIKKGYEIQLAEPISKWWEHIKLLISLYQYQDRKEQWHFDPLWNYAKKLEILNQHRMKQDKIYKRLTKFKLDVTVKDFLNYGK